MSDELARDLLGGLAKGLEQPSPQFDFTDVSSAYVHGGDHLTVPASQGHRDGAKAGGGLAVGIRIPVVAGGEHGSPKPTLLTGNCGQPPGQFGIVERSEEDAAK